MTLWVPSKSMRTSFTYHAIKQMFFATVTINVYKGSQDIVVGLGLDANLEDLGSNPYSVMKLPG